jgi:hypothetical protein
VVGGGREYILHNPDRSATGSLILFQNDFDSLTGPNVLPILAIHRFPPCKEYSDTNPGKIQIREAYRLYDGVIRLHSRDFELGDESQVGFPYLKLFEIRRLLNSILASPLRKIVCLSLRM